MAKKIKLTPEQKRRRSIRRLKRRIIQIALLVGLGGGAYLIMNPQIVPDPAKRAQVEEIRERVMGASVGVNEEQLDESEFVAKSETLVTDAFKKSKSYIEQAFKTVKIPKNLTNTDEEIVIEDVVNNFSEEIRQLPQEQVNKIKVQICKDILEES